ncbi:MAG: polymerase III, delta'' subunit protein [candidate division TM6 bacterium GW2011_GWE2_41_16]|nr:MAG: polymerase III, delta'' subunit protein [candidate division TM6 bacterium GW2011_GWE2_41_16]
MNKKHAIATLLLAPQEIAREHVHYVIHAHFCGCNQLNECALFQRIVTHECSKLLWITPSNIGSYKRSDLDVLFSSITYRADHDMFFVIERIDWMPPACANMLLKLLEESEPNVFFLLTAERLDAVLPTIVSRVSVEQLKNNIHASKDQSRVDIEAFVARMVALIQKKEHMDPLAFDEYVREVRPEVYQTHDILDMIMQGCSENVLEMNRLGTFEKIATLYGTIPMPGSAHAFWRYTYMHLVQE